MKKTLLILCGGRSDEHEISLISAKCILDAVDKDRFSPVVVGISKKGVWHLEDEDSFYTGAVRADQIKLNTSAPTVTVAPFLSPNGRGRLEAGNRHVDFDVVFPVLHGPFGEDGRIQGLLETIGIPFVGSNTGSSWNCMDKAIAKQICASAGIRTPPFVLLGHPDDLALKAREIQKLGFPLFVKPSRLGSSVGISKVTRLDTLAPAVETAFKFDSKVLIEQGVNAREIECAVLGLSRNARVALPGEIIPAAKVGWYSYEAKYLMEDGAELVVPANLTPTQVTQIQQFVLGVFRLLECDGMARIDLFLDKKTGEIMLNEVNTLPGFTPISMYPKMWQSSGLSYPALINELIELAFLREGVVFS